MSASCTWSTASPSAPQRGQGQRRGLGQGLRCWSGRTPPCSLLGKLVSFLSHGEWVSRVLIFNAFFSTCQKAWALNGRSCGLQSDPVGAAELSFGLKACGCVVASPLLTDMRPFSQTEPILGFAGSFLLSQHSFVQKVFFFFPINQGFFLFVFCQR